MSYFCRDIFLDYEMVKVLSCKLHTVLATGLIYSLRNLHYTIILPRRKHSQCCDSKVQNTRQWTGFF